MPELKPIAWATIYTCAGREDRIEIGDANPVRERNAELWGWQHRRVPLVEIPADQVLVKRESLSIILDYIKGDCGHSQEDIFHAALSLQISLRAKA
ncbi:TPA: hypothetical protein L5D59_006288 [Pseudomonas aeruginosa]|uniref:hypothetical protein n=1 Tax=Pseudomonas aeruginosa TaxID=287 RepID=UPI000EB2B87B|nr:hypothetical protein [Pseudomonas aeruginosa]QDB70943.1 hypothetical protein [Pseudomonas phage vB_PaeP_YA3]MDC3835483.1 hypothetical protein [Pseudomonas aeruginosa]MDF5883703.1 hypothetical protein [Pseudomonas aeruginosa]MDF5908330.1 hypothetical protein [Pseudomonas aeruginosa]MDF5919736.1 hypothetical protein [Pseudomonas aeruginosa]